jgi:hypothetical protein
MVTLPNSSTVLFGKKVDFTYGTVSPTRAAIATIDRIPPKLVLYLLYPLN